LTTVSFDVPEESLRALPTTPDQAGSAVRLAAAMFWYGRSEITLGTAAAFAGLSQAEFMRALKSAGHDTFVFDPDDFDQELAFLANRRAAGESGG
jgi:predicted HTH domain antitoxin